MNQYLTWQDFEKVEIRVGTIVSAEEFKEVKKPAYKLTIDFGDFGLKKSSAQITKLYEPKELLGKQIIAVTNFAPKQIANMMSECLVLGVLGSGDEITLLTTESSVPNGLLIG